ncbi:MAG: hypothetical protein OXL96_28555 [Candidatus Poribacteria bacterium]|nr:hypothetical protein [Candidatus Poribacteria bacterium]
MNRKPRMSTFVMVYVGLLICVAYRDALQFAHESTSLSGVVMVLLAIVGAVVAQHIWSGMDGEGVARIAMSAIVGGAWTVLPVFVSFVLVEPAIGPPGADEVFYVGGLHGSIVFGIGLWATGKCFWHFVQLVRNR